jgi:hypothetical protein
MNAQADTKVHADGMTLEQWLAVRKEAGLQMDPETAEVHWEYGRSFDPYGVYPDLPEECQCIGREAAYVEWTRPTVRPIECCCSHRQPWRRGIAVDFSVGLDLPPRPLSECIAWHQSLSKVSGSHDLTSHRAQR